MSKMGFVGRGIMGVPLAEVITQHRDALERFDGCAAHGSKHRDHSATARVLAKRANFEVGQQARSPASPKDCTTRTEPAP